MVRVVVSCYGWSLHGTGCVVKVGNAKTNERLAKKDKIAHRT